MITALDAAIYDLVARAFQEDVRSGDHTTNACIPADKEGEAYVVFKQKAFYAGAHLMEKCLKAFDSNINVKHECKDEKWVDNGTVVLRINGPLSSILMAERTALNLLQRVCGVATITAKMRSDIKHTKAKLLDTRKTSPGLRIFEKYGVRAGGGLNHRYGLFDMILIKDNHIDGSGSVTKAIYNAFEYVKEKKLQIPIMVEVRNFEELEQALQIDGLHRIMLDNFSLEDIKRAIDQIDGKVPVEISGGVNPQNVKAYAETGAAYLSAGCLTHSVENVDISLKIK